MNQRIMSLLLAIVMLIGALPLQTFAAETVETTAIADVSLEQSAAEPKVDEAVSLAEPAETEATVTETVAETTADENAEQAIESAPQEVISNEETAAVEVIASEETPVLLEEPAAEASSLDTSKLEFSLEEPDGYVTISFTDNGIRTDKYPPLNEELYGEPLGTIIAETKVPYVAGDTAADVTVRLLDAMKLEYKYTGTVDELFYLSALKNFELNGTYYAEFGEFNAGGQSGWCVRVNNWHINQASSAVEVEDGDVVSWLYTCQYGADIGADYSTKSAEIADVVLSNSALRLVYDEEACQYTCEVPADISAIAFEVLLANYASVVTVSVDGSEVKYRPNKDIPVTKNSTIVISSELDHMDADDNNKVITYTDSETIQLVEEEPNNAPSIKAAYAETNSRTYVYSSSYVFIYMDEIFEDADGDELTYRATLNGEEAEISYNSWSKQYSIQFAQKPAICEYKIVANDGKADSEVFTAVCIGTTATITAPEDAPLIEQTNNANYWYYIYDSTEGNTFDLGYTLDVDADIVPTFTSNNAAVTITEDGIATVNPVTSRTQVLIGVTYGKDQWNSPLYLGTKYIYVMPAAPEFVDITAPLAEHADNVKATIESNAVTGGWYSSEFDFEIADPSICDIALSGSYGLSVTPKALGTTTVTATFKHDPSMQYTFDVTVTGRSLQIKDQPDSDDVIYAEGKTVQLEVLGAEEGETFTWTSSDESVATVDENGLATVKKLGQTYITAVSSLSTEEAPVQASMYLQVKESGKVYLDDLALTQYTYFGHISPKAGFNSAQLTYDWALEENRYTYSTLQFTPYFDDENLDATLHYQVSGGEYQTMTLENEKAVSISNGLNPGKNVVMIDVYPTDNTENVTTYTFNILRPYNPSNTISRMTIYPNAETALAYPKYLGSAEGTLFQLDSTTGELVTGWNGSPSTGWSSSRDTYKAFVFGDRTSTVSIYPTFAYAGQRVMIYVDGEEFEEAVTTWKSKPIPVDEDGVTITLHVNSEKYHAEQTAAGVEDPFAEPEKIYTIFVENVTPLGIDAQILSAEISTGDFYLPGFQSNGYTLSALLPSDQSDTELTFTVPAGIDVYKGSVSDANKLPATGQNEDGNNVYTTALTITGTAANASSTTNIILQVTDAETGETGMTQYAFTLFRRGEKDVYPDSIVDYLCVGSQYTNISSYGTMPERTLRAGGSTLSLGNFGGYIVYKYDTPIENDPNNPYGVDFVIYGNSFGNGAHEPGYVQVSADGETWYTLAGSEHYEDHNDWDFSMTYTNNNGKSAWTNSDGESGEIYNYPTASAYPYFSWTEALEQSMTFSGPRLNSSAKDAYGSAAAVLPVFGYVDVNTNGTINGTAVNPYDHPGALASGGDQFDLDWAVDEAGMPVKLDSISYIRVATASSIYAGAIGEKSTEVTAVNRVTNAAESAVGITTAPTAITVNGKSITVPADGGIQEVNVPKTSTEAALTVAVTAAEDSNVYIGNTSCAERSYTTIPEKGIIRIIVQEGEKEPYICYLTLTEEEIEEAHVNVNVTISDAGTVVMAQQPIAVTDLNENGIFDMDDVLYAAHEAAYIGGAEAGYGSAETAYGLSLTKLWGDTSGAFGYWRNDASCWSLSDEVCEGDSVTAFVYQDSTGWSDAYSKFDNILYTGTNSLTVTLQKAGYDENWNTVFAAHAGAEIIAYDSNMVALDTTNYTVADNGNGTYSITFAEDGTYYLIASDNDPILVPAVCQVTLPNSPIRLYGRDRVATAFKIADTLKDTLDVKRFDSIILASGNNFADALAGSYLAAVKNAPILLYRSGSEADNLAYISESLTPGGTVYILGGTAAVPQEMENVLTDANLNVNRLKGSTRFGTNLKILEEAGIVGDEILVATGWDFADSLSASATGKPILMVNTNTNALTEDQITFLETMSGKKLTIIGGSAAVSEELEKELAQYSEVTRVYGHTREDTSVKVAEQYCGTSTTALLAYSRNFPDGLCGGPLAYAMRAPLLLVNSGKEEAAAGYVAEQGIDLGYILGGTAAVSTESAALVFNQ